MADIPVTMAGLRALVPVQFNGADAKLAVDSGAFYSLLSADSATQYHLKVSPTPAVRQIRGVNGSAGVGVTTINDFSIAGIPIPHLEFMVGGSDTGAEEAGLLGQNILGSADVEYDLANGALRLMKPEGCDSSSVLAYWAQASSIPYGVIELEEHGLARHTVGTVSVNGVRLRAMFDTGAPTSILNLAAAKRAGVTPESPGAVAAGFAAGIGGGGTRSWIGNFASVKLGTEEVKNTRLRFGDIGLNDLDMLIGADFFLSHRVYVANSQHRLYFTYNGGPVFNLAVPRVTAADAGRLPVLAQQLQEAKEDPTDADGYFRRGSAFEARRDFEHALADFSRAIELKPDYTDALIARARAHLVTGDRRLIPADLAAADRTVAKDSGVRLAMAQIYEKAELLAPATHQYDQWIASHQHDSYLPAALNEDCWARALSGQDLEKALDDCNRALQLDSSFWAAFDSRGWAQFRLGRFNKSIEDFEIVLRHAPKSAASLYGKGLDELRLGKQQDGKADVAAATALAPAINQWAIKYGLIP